MPPAAAAGAAVAAAAVAWLAWRARALTPGGGAAAWVVGTLVVWGAGVAGGLVLLAFFIPTILLGHLVRGRTAPELDAKGDCRDEWQVVANGGVAVIAALAARGEPSLGLWLLTGAFAAAGADTWATIWGALSPVPPRQLISGRRVPHGTSGGVTAVGTLGGTGGALVVALAGAAVGGGIGLVTAATAAGVGGMLADSALGGTLQGRFHCTRCDLPSEWRRHRCGAATRPTGGLRWLTNDGVNALATTTGALLAGFAWLWR